MEDKQGNEGYSVYFEVIPEIRRLRLDVSNLYLELGWLLEKVDKVYRQSIDRLTALEKEQERTRQ